MRHEYPLVGGYWKLAFSAIYNFTSPAAWLSAHRAFSLLSISFLLNKTHPLMALNTPLSLDFKHQKGDEIAIKHKEAIR